MLNKVLWSGSKLISRTMNTAIQVWPLREFDGLRRQHVQIIQKKKEEENAESKSITCVSITCIIQHAQSSAKTAKSCEKHRQNHPSHWRQSACHTADLLMSQPLRLHRRQTGQAGGCCGCAQPETPGRFTSIAGPYIIIIIIIDHDHYPSDHGDQLLKYVY